MRRVIALPDETHRTCNLGVDPRQLDEGLIEVLDSLGRIVWCLVADIADSAVWKELDVCDGVSAKVPAHAVLCEGGGQAAHKYARRLHGRKGGDELWPARIAGASDDVLELVFSWRVKAQKCTSRISCPCRRASTR